MNMVLQRALRIGTSVLALAVAAALGLAIAEWVIKLLKDSGWPLSDEYYVGTVLSLVGIILLVVKDLLLAFLKIWSYIWSGTSSGPDLGEALVWLTEAMVAVFILAVALERPPERCPESWQTCVTSTDGLSRKCALKCLGNHLTAQITQTKNEILVDHKVARLRSIASTPLLFPNARLGGEDDLSQKSHGVALEPDHSDQLRRIAQILQTTCQFPTSNVILRVVGSRSDAPFRGKSEERSNDLNLNVAVLRAMVVEAQLKKELAEADLDRVEVHIELWGKPTDVEPSAFPGVDHLALKDPQHQARSVFVEVVDPSACFVNPNP